MEFSKEFLSNPIFSEQPLSYRAPKPMNTRKPGSTAPGFSAQTGALVQSNGDIIFRVYAPNANTVTVAVARRECKLTKDENGLFEGLYPYDEHFAGPHTITVTIDGNEVIDPYFPIVWQHNRPVNFIEVPDPETDYALVKDVPHGAVTHEIYWSKELNMWLRCLVYTPAGARTSGEKYPVLYLQHGATEDETTWVSCGHMPYIIDNMIAEGKCDPFIVVMNDGMVRYPTTPEGPFSDTAMEDNLVGSCIPYIEANYPVKTDKWSRAIAGLSMGSGQCATTAYHHPDMFGYIGMFSGKCGIDKEKTPDLYEYAKDTENFDKQYKVYFRGMGDCDESSMFTNFPIDDAVLHELGVDKIAGYHRVTYPDQTHEYGAWRRMLYDFAQLIFK